MSFNFSTWISRFKKYDETNHRELTMTSQNITTETSFNSLATDTRLVRDDGISFQKNSKGAWEKAPTLATSTTFGGVRVEWLDATTVNIITQEPD